MSDLTTNGVIFQTNSDFDSLIQGCTKWRTQRTGTPQADFDRAKKWFQNQAEPGGALGQVSYGGVQLRGPNPYPILGKAGLRKHTLF